MSSNKIPVVVTGASGFLASYIIKLLLESGRYSVVGTVRSTKDENKLKFLKALDTIGDLKLVESDLLKEGSFDEAVKGAEVVFHTASPFTLRASDPQKDLVDPAVNGTKNVLEACLKEKRIKKVIVTSSVAAITDSPKKNHIYTEDDWNTESNLTRNPYYYSKVLAEKEAWKYDGKAHFQVIVTNPFVILGPEMNPNATTANASNDFFVQLLTGKLPALLDWNMGVVDVRDVAKAHLLVAEQDTKGRHIIWKETVSMKVLAEHVVSNFPQYKSIIPNKDLTCGLGTWMVKMSSYFQEAAVGQYLRTNLGTNPQLSNKKITNLGLTFTDLDTTVKEAVQSLIDNGQIPKN